jgi:hypothetical protein
VEDPNATLIDVPRMFVDAPFREAVLARVTNPTVKQFWEQNSSNLNAGSYRLTLLSYVISKLGRFY